MSTNPTNEHREDCDRCANPVDEKFLEAVALMDKKAGSMAVPHPWKGCCDDDD